MFGRLNRSIAMTRPSAALRQWPGGGPGLCHCQCSGRAERCRSNQAQQVRGKRRVGVGQALAPAPRTPTLLHGYVRVEFLQPPPYGAGRDADRPRHGSDPAIAQRPHLGRGEQPTPTLVQTRVQQFVMPATESEIIDFGKRYDPQVFHIDPVAAASTPAGGLIASGWQTAGLAMRMLVDNYISKVASLVSPGIDELRWTKVVRPNDVLRVRVTVLEARRSRSKPDRGVVNSKVEVLNQHGETVMTMRGMNLLLCRSAG